MYFRFALRSFRSSAPIRDLAHESQETALWHKLGLMMRFCRMIGPLFVSLCPSLNYFLSFSLMHSGNSLIHS